MDDDLWRDQHGMYSIYYAAAEMNELLEIFC